MVHFVFELLLGLELLEILIFELSWSQHSLASRVTLITCYLYVYTCLYDRR